MSVVIVVHSFHRGVGKTFTAVNLAASLAAKGQRVGIVDTSLQSPGVHYPLGIREDTIEFALNDFLHGRSDIQQATYNITPQLKTDIKGQIFLTPASLEVEDIMQVVRKGYNLDVFRRGLDDLSDKLDLDTLVIDTHAGLDEQTLKIIALSDVLIIIMRLETHEYQGTGVTIEVARKFDLSDVQIVVNHAPLIYSAAQIEAEVQKAYHCPLLMSIPYSQEVAELAGADVLTLHHPQHPISRVFTQAIDSLPVS